MSIIRRNAAVRGRRRRQSGADDPGKRNAGWRTDQLKSSNNNKKGQDMMQSDT